MTYAGATAAVLISLATDTANGGDATGDELNSIENSDHNDTLTGNDGVNVLRGSEGLDTISGMGGDDTIRGDEGSDFLNGGTARIRWVMQDRSLVSSSILATA